MLTDQRTLGSAEFLLRAASAPESLSSWPNSEIEAERGAW